MINVRSINVDNSLVRLWLVLLVAAVGSLADVAEFAARESSHGIMLAGLACVAVLKATALTAIYAVCRENRWWRIGAIVLIGAFFVLSLINGCSTLFYGFGFTMKLFTIVAQTNYAEVVEFIPELSAKFLDLIVSPVLWVAFGVFIVAWIWMPRISARWLAISSLSLSGLGLVYLLVVVVPAEFGRMNHSMFGRSARCVVKYCSDRRRIRELEVMKRPLPFPETLISPKSQRRVVVVIGESASRDHLSLYGYPLPTTPRLDSIKDDLLIFSDAVASSTSTAENMPRLLTFMNDSPGEKEWYEYPSVLQIFHELGYRTYWLSNQEYSGRWSNLSCILSSDADILKYVGSMDSEDHYLDRYDDVLLPEWNKAYASVDSLQLTFIHLMGSHFQYSRRFPKSRHFFKSEDVVSRMPRKWLDRKKADIVADYDNSILYTDSILSVVMDGIQHSDIPTVMIYLSDHGENVYDDRDYRGRDPKFVKVPFIIFVNQAYREQNPEIIEDIQNSLSKPFSTSELPQMLMHLTGTSYELYDSVRDPLSAAFRSRQRWVDGEVFYRDIATDVQ